MRQRVMIAMALSCRPAVLLPMSQPPRWMSLFRRRSCNYQSIAKRDVDGRYLYHSRYGVVAEIADRVLVMYQGEAVETVPSNRFFMHRNILTPVRC